MAKAPTKQQPAPAAKPSAAKAPPAPKADPNVETTEVKLPKGFKLPKTLAECADLLYALKDEKSKAQKVVDEIEAKQKALQAHLINSLPKSNATGVTGKVANAKIATEEVPQAEDWPSIYEFIRKNKAFELLNKALNKAAIKERWEAGKAIPGVRRFTVVKVSLTKA